MRSLVPMRCVACLLGIIPVVSVVSAAKIIYEVGELKLRDPDEVGSVVVSPLPHTYLKPSDIPAEWNPHDIDGITLVTSDLNQHIPQCEPTCILLHFPLLSTLL